MPPCVSVSASMSLFRIKPEELFVIEMLVGLFNPN